MRPRLVSKCSASHSGSFSAYPVQIRCVVISLRTLCIIPYISTHTLHTARIVPPSLFYFRMHSQRERSKWLTWLSHRCHSQCWVWSQVWGPWICLSTDWLPSLCLWEISLSWRHSMSLTIDWVRLFSASLSLSLSLSPSLPPSLSLTYCYRNPRDTICQYTSLGFSS